ncbi:MAG: FAD-binding protein [Planctomycetes bacterium]|nr:FAD-binding protein [Planctomycetota bacterium]
MPLPTDFDSLVRSGVSLAPMTAIGLGGPAAFFTDIPDPGLLPALFDWARSRTVPVFVLGGGSNLVVADEGINALVVRFVSGGPFGRLELSSESGDRTIVAGPAVPTASLLRFAAENACSGLEFLAGIPGSVGGAVATGAGGRFGSISEILVGFSGFPFAPAEKETGSYWLDRPRDADDFIVLDAVLRVHDSTPDAVLGRMDEILDYRRRTQPAGVLSAGCIFRNPPQGPSAGELIDRAGFKGRARGGARVSDVHANYIVNAGGATALDVVALAFDIIDAVHDSFGVRLALGVDIWGESLEEFIADRGYC